MGSGSQREQHNASIWPRLSSDLKLINGKIYKAEFVQIVSFNERRKKDLHFRVEIHALSKY